MPNQQSVLRRQKGRYNNNNNNNEEEEEDDDDDQLKHLRLHLFTFSARWLFLTIPLSITLTCLSTYS